MARSGLALPIHQIVIPTPFVIGPVHAYLIEAEPVTLIDCGVGTPEGRQALLDALAERGFAPGDIQQLILTHAHHDHAGNARFFEEAGARVYLHPLERGKLFNPPAYAAARAATLIASGVPDEVVQAVQASWNRMPIQPPSETLPLSSGQRFSWPELELEVVPLPGHALGQVGLYDAGSGVLVGADHLLLGTTPNPVVEPGPVDDQGTDWQGRCASLSQFLDSLERVRALAPRQVLPGHGPVIDDPLAVVEGYRAEHERRLERYTDLLAGRGRQGATAWDISRTVYPHTRGVDIFLALSEVLAHLDVLVARGRANRTDRDGTEYFWVSAQ